jgi:hypothetical protein
MASASSLCPVRDPTRGAVLPVRACGWRSTLKNAASSAGSCGWGANRQSDERLTNTDRQQIRRWRDDLKGSSPTRARAVIQDTHNNGALTPHGPISRRKAIASDK